MRRKLNTKPCRRCLPNHQLFTLSALMFSEEISEEITKFKEHFPCTRLLSPRALLPLHAEGQRETFTHESIENPFHMSWHCTTSSFLFISSQESKLTSISDVWNAHRERKSVSFFLSIFLPSPTNSDMRKRWKNVIFHHIHSFGAREDGWGERINKLFKESVDYEGKDKRLSRTVDAFLRVKEKKVQHL